ncbi:NADH-quinone oxidoreductase subunit C [Streptomyces sp. CA-250714]|uniref:NADH-quinone oxidoreductase subunit C n=1 Tax=Streptomyces sp. CA-250714 TaxID=3240060 RepID=UPI003D8B8417
MTEPPQHPGWLPRPADELFGEGATAEDAYGLLTVDVPAEAWIPALTAARDELGCTYFDWLSAVDEPGTGFRTCAHLVALPAPGTGVRRLVLRTTIPHEAAALPTATGVYAGAAWHERETHEMFGVDFPGHPHLVPLLLPDSFEGHPLRKDFVLAARVVKAWPGAKEPGESGHGGPKRRQMLPPGVPDPNEWGPLKGQLPPAPTRERSRRATGDTPRRTRSASAGSASQQDAEAAATTPRKPRRDRSASSGSASQRATRGEQPAPTEEPAPSEGRPAAEKGRAAGERPAAGAPRTPRSTDAPWRHAPSAGEAESGPDSDAKQPDSDAKQDESRDTPQETGGDDNRTGDDNPTGDDSRTGDGNRSGDDNPTSGSSAGNRNQSSDGEQSESTDGAQGDGA